MGKPFAVSIDTTFLIQSLVGSSPLAPLGREATDGRFQFFDWFPVGEARQRVFISVRDPQAVGGGTEGEFCDFEKRAWQTSMCKDVDLSLACRLECAGL